MMQLERCCCSCFIQSPRFCESRHSYSLVIPRNALHRNPFPADWDGHSQQYVPVLLTLAWICRSSSIKNGALRNGAAPGITTEGGEPPDNLGGRIKSPPLYLPSIFLPRISDSYQGQYGVSCSLHCPGAQEAHRHGHHGPWPRRQVGHLDWISGMLFAPAKPQSPVYSGAGWMALAQNWRRRGMFDEVAFIFPNAPMIPITVVCASDPVASGVGLRH